MWSISSYREDANAGVNNDNENSDVNDMDGHRNNVDSEENKKTANQLDSTVD